MITNNLGRPLTPKEIRYVENTALHGRGYTNSDVAEMTKEERQRILDSIELVVDSNTSLKSTQGFFS